METISCHDCGNPVSPNARACLQCGSTFPSGPARVSRRGTRANGVEQHNDQTLISMLILCTGIGFFFGAVTGGTLPAFGYALHRRSDRCTPRLRNKRYAQLAIVPASSAPRNKPLLSVFVYLRAIFPCQSIRRLSRKISPKNISRQLAASQTHGQLSSFTPIGSSGGVANVDEPIGACITAQYIGPGPRFRALAALVKLRGGNSELIKSINRFSVTAQGVAGERNRWSHDPMFVEDETGDVFRWQATADRVLVFELKPGAIAQSW
jgi:hypothetical protein